MAPNFSMAQDGVVLPTVEKDSVFISRLVAIPSVQKVLQVANQVYVSTKTNYSYVGVALGVVEAGVRMAASGALPVMTPIVDRVVGLHALDAWACHGLDRVEKSAPLISKEPMEVLAETRKYVLISVSGSTEDVPNNFSSAVFARVGSTVSCLSSCAGNTVGGKVVSGYTDRFLDVVNLTLDKYIPPIEGDAIETVEGDGILSKFVALSSRTRVRLYRIATNKFGDDLTLRKLIGTGQVKFCEYLAAIFRDPNSARPVKSCILMAANFCRRVQVALQYRLSQLAKYEGPYRHRLDTMWDFVTRMAEQLIEYLPEGLKNWRQTEFGKKLIKIWDDLMEIFQLNMNGTSIDAIDGTKAIKSGASEKVASANADVGVGVTSAEVKEITDASQKMENKREKERDSILADETSANSGQVTQRRSKKPLN